MYSLVKNNWFTKNEMKSAMIKVFIVLCGALATANAIVCSSDADCAYTSMQGTCEIDAPCNQGNCECPDGYYEDGSDCLEMVMLGDSCSANIECGELAICSSGTCSCHTGATADGSYDCEADAEIGDACSDSGACIPEFSMCTSSVCTCNDGFTESNADCVPNDRGTACSSDSDCMSILGLVCTNSVCACIDDTLIESSNSFFGITFEFCRHPDGQMNLGLGESCDRTMPTNDARYSSCDFPLECGTCPEAPSTNICKDGAAMTTAGMLLVFLAPLFARLF